MLKEIATVIDYSNGVATVSCQRKHACGHCAAKSTCGTAALSTINGEHQQHQLQVSSLQPLKKGQLVEIGLWEKTLLHSAWWAYGIPLLIVLSVTILANLFTNSEGITAIIILTTLAIYFACLRLFLKRKNYQITILKILS